MAGEAFCGHLKRWRRITCPQDLRFTKLLDNLFGLELLAWHERPPVLGPIPEFTTLELVAAKGAGHRLQTVIR